MMIILIWFSQSWVKKMCQKSRDLWQRKIKWSFKKTDSIFYHKVWGRNISYFLMIMKVQCISHNLIFKLIYRFLVLIVSLVIMIMTQSYNNRTTIRFKNSVLRVGFLHITEWCLKKVKSLFMKIQSKGWV